MCVCVCVCVLYIYVCVCVCYMSIDVGKRIAGKQDGPSLIIAGPSAPLELPKMLYFHIGAHI